VRDALSSLQFVEKTTIKADVKTKRVEFSADKTQFDLAKVKAAIAAKGFEEVKLISGPKKA
jgi:hypothetical protein